MFAPYFLNQPCISTIWDTPVWLPGRKNSQKGYLIHTAAHNLGLLKSTLFKYGHPKRAVTRKIFMAMNLDPNLHSIFIPYQESRTREPIGWSIPEGVPREHVPGPTTSKVLPDGAGQKPPDKQQAVA